MRQWRKIEKAILTSKKLSRVSDSAKWLFTLLLVAQDDAGRYPYDGDDPECPDRITLTATARGWNSDVYESLLSELRTAGIIETQDGFIWLKSGAEKNGTPSNSKKFPLYYPTPELGTETQAYAYESQTQDSQTSRVDKSRVDIDKEKPSKKKVLDPSDIEGLIEKHQEALGGAEAVREEIKAALNHKAVDKAKDLKQYVDTWLRRAMQFNVTRNGAAKTLPKDEDYEAAAERYNRAYNG